MNIYLVDDLTWDDGIISQSYYYMGPRALDSTAKKGIQPGTEYALA